MGAIFAARLVLRFLRLSTAIPRGTEIGAGTIADDTTIPSLAQRDGEPGGDLRGRELNRLSNAMVHLYKEYFGRGPTKARSVFAGRDAVLCTLEDSFTPAEQALVRMGEFQRLRDTRIFLQYATETQFRETVEKILGRKVRAFVSGIDARVDVSSELFYLEPSEGSGGQPQGEAAADGAPTDSA